MKITFNELLKENEELKGIIKDWEEVVREKEELIVGLYHDRDVRDKTLQNIKNELDAYLLD